ncbi:MAG TPA: hypothetical protein VJ874_06250 [Candidatus Thermoplasmatota archaeon]|nr:hypothetical protein [Candidatus Thermoplasmatota archaeon]
MAGPAFAVLLVGWALVLAGCSVTDEEGSPTGSWSLGTPTSQTTVSPSGPPSADEVALSGSVRALGHGFAANVSARNVGQATFTYGQTYCTSGYGAWSARLLDPTGSEVEYRPPDDTQLSCAGSTDNPMPPWAYVNWTASDAQASHCSTKSVCDNVWDGNLTGSDGNRTPAPPGLYTWRFTFRWWVGAYSPANAQASDLDLAVVVR